MTTACGGDIYESPETGAASTPYIDCRSTIPGIYLSIKVTVTNAKARRILCCQHQTFLLSLTVCVFIDPLRSVVSQMIAITWPIAGRCINMHYSWYGTVDKAKRPRVSDGDQATPAADAHGLELEP